MNWKNFFKIKQYIISLPANHLNLKLYGYYIIVSAFGILVAILHPDFWGIIKATYDNANMPWPPELNMVNLAILRDMLFMVIILLILFFFFNYIFSLIISKVLLLFKRQISLAKTWNILLYASVISAMIEVVGLIIFVTATYSFMFYDRSVDYFRIYSLFQSASLILVVITLIINPLINLVLAIWGIKISIIKVKK